MKEPEQRAIEFLERLINEVKKKFEDNDLDCDYRVVGFEEHEQVYEVRLYDQTAHQMANPFAAIAAVRIVRPKQPRFYLRTVKKDDPSTIEEKEVDASELQKLLLTKLKNLYNGKEKNWPTLPASSQRTELETY